VPKQFTATPLTAARVMTLCTLEDTLRKIRLKLANSLAAEAAGTTTQSGFCAPHK